MSGVCPARIISVIGGCQVSGLAATAQALLPGATIRRWHVGVDPASAPQHVAAAISDSDLVLSQFDHGEGPPDLCRTQLEQRGIRVVHIPVFAFPGFHPDMTYIIGTAGQIVPGAGSDYHSLIVAACYRLGFSVERTARLFNGYVFAGLGYFQVFEVAKVALIQGFEQKDYRIAPHVEAWRSQVGQFMYTLNHPHITVLSDLCRIALVKAGEIPLETVVPAAVPDDLARSFTAPVFPALARHLKITGSTLYRRATSVTVTGCKRDWPLRDYVAASFATYALSKSVLDGDVLENTCNGLKQLGVVPPPRNAQRGRSLVKEAREASEAADWPLAMLLWQRLLEDSPALEEAHVRLGDAWRELGDLDASERVSVAAWKACPGNLWVGRNWALAAQRRRDFGEAVDRYREVAGRHHNDVLQSDLAECLLDDGDLAGAKAVIAAASIAFPTSHWVEVARQRIASTDNAMSDADAAPVSQS